jgi:hypothetical protein
LAGLSAPVVAQQQATNPFVNPLRSRFFFGSRFRDRAKSEFGFGVGLGYNFFSLDIGVDDDSWQGRINS